MVEYLVAPGRSASEFESAIAKLEEGYHLHRDPREGRLYYSPNETIEKRRMKEESVRPTGGRTASYLCTMKRSTYLYALSMAGLLFLLKLIDYKYLVYDLKMEYYVSVIALVFTLLGLWIGRKLTATHRPRPVLAEVSSSARTSPADLGISPRENEVLHLIAAGHSNQEIADRLFLSLNTIKKHTSTLFRKLEAERRTQAIEKARKQ